MFPARRTYESRRQTAGRSFASITWVCPFVLPATRRAVCGNRSRTGVGCVRSQTRTSKENLDNVTGLRHKHILSTVMLKARVGDRAGLFAWGDELALLNRRNSRC